MTLTVCWSTKGGSGTTVVAALLALHPKRRSLLVDLDGDAGNVLGVAPPAGQGLSDWFDSGASVDAVADLAVDVNRTTRLVPRGVGAIDRTCERWDELGGWLTREHSFDIVVDAGLGEPHPALRASGDTSRTLLITRPCFLSLRRAAALSWRADGVILINEPGRSFTRGEVEHSLGIPVVARLELDPAIARAVDSGLAAARLPKAAQRLHDAA